MAASESEKYICEVCGYEYDPKTGDPDNDIAAGTAWDQIAEDWLCPVCGAGKEAFEVA
ncbi:MAG: rubredoxin [Desulfobacterales bacterium]|nr:rubredoxin [Desulfobacterales bacterium]